MAEAKYAAGEFQYPSLYSGAKSLRLSSEPPSASINPRKTLQVS